MPKTILMTGMCTVFGKLIADTLAGDGNSVIAVVHMDICKNAASAEELGRIDNVEVVNADLSNDESITRAIVPVIKKYGVIDVLLNNVGTVGFGAPDGGSMLEQIRNIFEVNVLGVIRTYQAVLPVMKGNGGGLIINIANDGESAMFALEAIAGSVAAEFAANNIENVIIPCKQNIMQNCNSKKDECPECRQAEDAFKRAAEATFQEVDQMQAYAKKIADAVLNIVNMKHGTRPKQYVF